MDTLTKVKLKGINICPHCGSSNSFFKNEDEHGKETICIWCGCPAPEPEEKPVTVSWRKIKRKR